jgi:DNA-binding NarL/FixJ family response regulator
MPGDIQNAFNAGAVNYISKSFDFNEFTSSLKDALDTILPGKKKFTEYDICNMTVHVILQ